MTRKFRVSYFAFSASFGLNAKRLERNRRATTSLPGRGIRGWVKKSLRTSPVWAATENNHSGMIGIVTGQTVRINVVNTIGDPDILPTPVTLKFLNSAGRVIGAERTTNLRPGRSVSLDLNADTLELGSGVRYQLRVMVTKTDDPETPINEAREILSTVEIFDNNTGMTRLVIRGFNPQPEPPG